MPFKWPKSHRLNSWMIDSPVALLIGLTLIRYQNDQLRSSDPEATRWPMKEGETFCALEGVLY